MTANRYSSAVGGRGPTLMSAGNNQFGVYVDASNNMWAVMFDRTTRAISSGPYNLASIAGNPLSLPLDTGDDHEGPSIGVDSGGRAWVAGNMYNVGPRLVRATSAGQVTSWESMSSSLPNPAGSYHGYYNFNRFSDGAMLLLLRIRYNSPSFDDPGGERCLYLAPGADTFTDRGYVMLGASATEDAFYRNQAYVDSSDTIHLFGAWDQSYTGGAVVDGFSYLYSTDRGVTWRNKAGTALTCPFNRTDASGVACRTGISYDSDTLNQYSAAGTTLDANGYPCGVYSKQGGNQRIVRWNGSAWTIDTTAGSYYIGGQNLNLVNFRGDLWSLQRTGTFVELRRHDGSVHEVARLGGDVPGGWYAWADPVALLAYDTVETLIPDPNPTVYTFGNQHRATAV
jgi:hypothetical protein